MQPATAPVFPDPYLQPDRNQDCGYYAAAYVARCLGHPDVTADQVRAWRAETRYHETAYAREVLGADVRTFWDEGDDEKRRKWFWLGPGLANWVMAWTFTGWIGQVMLHRIPDLGHAAVILGAGPDGVLLMDPIYGHVTEPWEWFLGIGPGKYGCHFIEGWYKPHGAVAAESAEFDKVRAAVKAARG
jgi:hypothetical protein